MKLLIAIFKLRPSTTFSAILLAIHFGAICCIDWVIIYGWLRLVLIFCILGHWLVTMRTYVWLNGGYAIAKFGLGVDGEWYLQRVSQDLFAVLPDYPIFISRYLVVMNFVTTTTARPRKIALPIFRDAVSNDEFRRLKMLLRTEQRPSSRGLQDQDASPRV